jgi:hypothetical protein
MLPRRGVRNTRTPFEGSDALRRTEELQRLTTRELCIKYENGTYPETDSMPTMGGPVGQMRFSAATLTEAGAMTLPGTLTVDGGSTLRGATAFTGAVDIAGQLTATGLSRLEGPVEIVSGPTVLAGDVIMLSSPPPQSAGTNDVLSYNATTGLIELQTAVSGGGGGGGGGGGATTGDIDASTITVSGISTFNGKAVHGGAVDIQGQLTATGLSRLEGTVEIVNGPTILAGDTIVLNPPPLASSGNNDVLSYNAITGAIELQTAGNVGSDISASTITVSGISTFNGKAVHGGAVDVQGQLTATGLSRLEGAVEIVNGPTTVSGSTTLNGTLTLKQGITGATAAGVTQNLAFGQDYRLIARNVASCIIWYQKGTDYFCLPLLPSTSYSSETAFGNIVPPSGFTGTAMHFVIGPYSQLTLTSGTVTYTIENPIAIPVRNSFPIPVNGFQLTPSIVSGSSDTYRLICSPSIA